MVIDFISDTHLNYKHLEDKLTGDVLVHCGDWSRDGSEEETESFIEWLDALPHREKIIVPGNHERYIEARRNACDYPKAMWLFGEYNISMLIDTEYVVDGIKFYGMPWTQFYNHWAFAYENSAHAKELTDAIPMDTDILITHTPPFGLFDENSHRHQLGCTYVRDAVERVRPAIHAFGHVHECGGMNKKFSNLTAYPHPSRESLNCAKSHFQREVVTKVINKGDPNETQNNK